MYLAVLDSQQASNRERKLRQDLYHEGECICDAEQSSEVEGGSASGRECVLD